MALAADCPNCRKTLNLPDGCLGRTVRCPLCQMTFRTGGDEDAPAPPRRTEREPSVPLRREAAPRSPRRPDPDEDEEDFERRREQRREQRQRRAKKAGGFPVVLVCVGAAVGLVFLAVLGGV